MVGDTPWDVESARRAGVETVCLLTGGFAEQELRDAGAVDVFESLPELTGTLSSARWR
jgi:phosphoglycolate phosphatase-like HAD superfamily hydrolase